MNLEYIFNYIVITLLCMVILFPLFMFKLVGAGDIKCISIIIGSLGYVDGCKVVLYTLFFSGIYSLISMIIKGILFDKIKKVVNYFISLAINKKIIVYERDEEASIRIGIFILIGYLVWFINIWRINEIICNIRF